MTLEEALRLAMQSFEAGQLEQAVAIAQQIVAQVPQCDRARQVLGGVAYRRGQWSLAEEHLREALKIAPLNLDYQDNLASALNQQERFDEAATLAREITQRDPGRLSGWNSLGLALKGLHRLAESEAAFCEALRLQPRFVLALNNLSNVLRMQGKGLEAEQAARQALALQPGLIEALVNLGTALHEQARYEEAITAFDEALRLRPNVAQAAFNRGIALEHLDRLSDSEASYRHALELRPEWPLVLNNLGNVLKAQGRLDEALATFDGVLASNPNYMVAHTNRLSCLLCRFGTTAEEVLAAHREWDARHAVRENAPFVQQIQARSASECVPNKTHSLAPRACRAPRHLRVGFVSPDFGNHPVGRFLIGIFENIPREEVETFCYSDRKQFDEITARFRAAAAHWTDARLLTDVELTEAIRRDELDLLIDLAGHTGNHRLLVFARRPAPQQATWIGYPGTTGLSAIDWIIADSVLIPSGSERFYSERVMRLPRSSICFEPPSFARDWPLSRSPCERTDGITFGSFNKLDKTTPDVLRVWAKILNAVPSSRLVLRNKGLDDGAVAKRFRSLLQQAGVSSEQVLLHGWCSHEELLAAYSNIDVALDTFPFSGGATSADALWCGVPIVTLASDTFASRQTASMLLNAGLTETVTTSVDDYVAKAVQLALHPTELSALRRKTYESIRSGPLMQPNEVAQDLVAAMREMVALRD